MAERTEKVGAPVSIEVAAATTIEHTTDSPTVTLLPKTTAEQDRTSYSQRRVNLIWESTQSVIAILVTVSTLYVSAALALQGAGQVAAFLLLSNAFFLVIGFYFGRTNHARTGGVGGDQAKSDR